MTIFKNIKKNKGVIMKEETLEKNDENIIKDEDKENLIDKNTISISKEEYDALSNIKTETEKKYLYSMAEFDNCKKRLAKEAEDRIKYANEKLIVDVLPVLDNFSLAIDHIKKTFGEDNTNESFITGVEMIFNQLIAVLSKYGVNKVPTIGENFDPKYHEALDQDKNKAYKSGTVIREYQTGYVLNDKLLRCSKVCVCKNEENN